MKDRYAELGRCLRGLRGCGCRVIVVDDCSADGDAIASIAAEAGASVMRRAVNGGPGAARNTGLAAASTPFVAFLDSDCVPRAGWLEELLPHFADPAVGAVAPRIGPHEAGPGWLARYEGASSTLDMGARPSIVRPGARVPYVPGAALVVRRSAAGSGFAPGLVVGEDVDFVWRLAAAGWTVRYEPGAVMGHDHRVRFRAWFSRRADYGTSAAALERSHPGAVRPLYASWWTIAAWTALLSGRPVTAAAVTAASTALLARRLSALTAERPAPPAERAAPPLRVCRTSPTSDSDGANGYTRATPSTPPHTRSRDSDGAIASPEEPQPGDNSKKRRREAGEGAAEGPAEGAAEGAVEEPAEGAAERTAGEAAGGMAWRLAIRLAGGGTLGAARPLGSALSRAWWPLAIPAAVAVPRLRLPVAALMLAPPLLDWADRRPPLDPVRYTAARLLDDAAYSLGVWQGCLRHRTLRPLLPVLGARKTGRWQVLVGHHVDGPGVSLKRGLCRNY